MSIFRARLSNLRFRTRLILSLVVLALISVIPVGFSIYLTTYNAMTSELDDSLNVLAQRLQGFSQGTKFEICAPEASPEVENYHRIRNRALSGAPGIAAQCFRPDGTLINSIGASVGSTPIQKMATGGKPVGPVTQSFGGARYRVITIPVADGNQIRVMRDLSETDEAMDRLKPRIIGTGLFAIVIAAVVGWFVASRETRGIVNLTRIAQDIAMVGRPTQLIEMHATSNNEVGKLTRSFASMMQALARSQEQQQQLVQDAGHELRTPLTSIRMNIGTLKRYGDLDPAMRERVLDDIDNEVAELTNLVNEVVAMSSDDFMTEQLQDVDLAESAKTAAERTARRNNRNVIVDAEPCIITGRPGRVMRAATNLLENAAKFSPPDTPIEIKVRPMRIEVRDYGPGIPPNDLERIFDRFYRSSESRSKPGSGLGLAITRQIIEDGGGTIRAENAECGGARFIIEIPEQYCNGGTPKTPEETTSDGV